MLSNCTREFGWLSQTPWFKTALQPFGSPALLLLGSIKSFISCCQLQQGVAESCSSNYCVPPTGCLWPQGAFWACCHFPSLDHPSTNCWWLQECILLFTGGQVRFLQKCCLLLDMCHDGARRRVIVSGEDRNREDGSSPMLTKPPLMSPVDSAS